MLRLVQPDEEGVGTEQPTSNATALNAVIDRLTLGRTPEGRMHIFHPHEATALKQVLEGRPFSTDQLEAWEMRLLADHPFHRQTPPAPRFGYWAWLSYVFLGRPTPPEPVRAETVDEWRRRADRFVDEQIAGVATPHWLTKPLADLDSARRQIQDNEGRGQWTMPVLRWALVQLLTIPAENNLSRRATG